VKPTKIRVEVYVVEKYLWEENITHNLWWAVNPFTVCDEQHALIHLQNTSVCDKSPNYLLKDNVFSMFVKQIINSKQMD
jgi:hypothetical protein